MFPGTPDMFTPDTHEVNDTDPLLDQDDSLNKMNSTVKQVEDQVIKSLQDQSRLKDQRRKSQVSKISVHRYGSPSKNQN